MKIARFAVAIAVLALLPVRGAIAQQNCPSPEQLSAITALRDAQALSRLGDLYDFGQGTAANPYLAFAYHSRAAELASSSSKMRVIDMLLTGRGTERDVSRAIAMLEELGRDGSTSALTMLGEIYSRGRELPMNPKKAITSFERAAKAGDQRAMLKLAEFYHYGRYASPQRTRAESYYKQAIKAGEQSARVGLGTLILERKSRRPGLNSKSALAEYKKAAAAGVERAQVALARVAISASFSNRRRLAEMQKLVSIADKGNDEAKLEVLAIYRDGFIQRNRLVLLPDRRKAQAYLSKYENSLGREAFAKEEFLLQAKTNTRQGYKSMSRTFDELPLAVKRSVLRSLARTNSGFYLFIAQSQLRSLGLYRQKPDGILNASTRRAMRQFCKSRAPAFFCAAPVASNGYAEILAGTFADSTPASGACKAN